MLSSSSSGAALVRDIPTVILGGCGLVAGWVLGRRHFGCSRSNRASAEEDMSNTISTTRPWDSSFVNNYDAFLFDCDGVLWRGNTQIPGAIDTIKQLRSSGKKVLMVTNNSTKSRLQYTSKLANYGLTATEDDILSASYAAASYLNSLDQFDKKTQKVFYIGDAGIGLELKRHGIESLAANDMFPQDLSLEEIQALGDPDPAIGCVIIGLDVKMSYTKVAYAQACLQNPDCLFISTNQDSTFPGAKRILPGGGSCVRFLACAAGREPTDCGKPNTWMLDIACKRLKIEPHRALMVGDRLNTDIDFAQRGGLDQMLVLTGITKQSELATSPIVPTFWLDSVANMFQSTVQ